MTDLRRWLLAAAVLFVPVAASAQTTGNFGPTTLSSAKLNAVFGGKADTSHGTLTSPTINAPTITNWMASPANLPAATTSALGAVQVGAGLGVSSGNVSVQFGTTTGTAYDGGLGATATATANTAVTNAAAAQTTANAAQTTANAAIPQSAIGSTVAPLVGSVVPPANLPAATTSSLGAMIPGTGLGVSGGTVSVQYGTTSQTAYSGDLGAAAAAIASAALPKSGGTVTGGITQTGGSFTNSVGGITASAGAITEGTTAQVVLSGAQATVNGAAGTNRLLRINTGGSSRWSIFGDGTAESGSNAGTNLNITAYNDAGTALFTPFSINRASGEISISLTPNITAPSAMMQLNANSLTGSGSSFSLFNIIGNGDNAAMTNGITDVSLVHTLGGTAFFGNRTSLSVTQNINASSPSATSSASSEILGYNVLQQASAPLGGIAGSPNGTLNAIDSVQTLSSGAMNYKQVANALFDISAQSGSSVSQKIGVAIDLLGGDAVAGTAIDTALTFGRTIDAPNSLGWTDLISVGNLNGWNPVNPTAGCIMCVLYGSVSGGVASLRQADRGIDLSGMNFLSASFRSNGWGVTENGNSYFGPGLLSWSGSTVSLDAPGEVAGNPTIVSAGAGYSAGQTVTTGNGDSYTVTSVSGTGIASLSTITQATIRSSSPPSNPLALKGDGAAGGNPATISLTWSSPTIISLAASGQSVKLGGQLTYAASTTGSGTETFTNSPCTGLTTEKWIPVSITGQTGTFYVPACQ